MEIENLKKISQRIINNNEQTLMAIRRELYFIGRKIKWFVI